VDDGSTDQTAAIVDAMTLEHPRLRLIRQLNTGKSGALNRGILAMDADVVVTLDADTVLAPQTVGNLARHFAVDRDGRLGAVAGVIRVGNRTRNLLTRWQALEYLTQIGVDRSAHDAFGAIVIVPGACAAWRRKAVLAAGGYSHETLAEDCDLTLSLHRAGWRVTQDDEAVAYTEAPEDVDGLLAQRTRWSYGTMQAIFKHRDLLLRPRWGWLGMLVLPTYVLSIVMPLLFLRSPP
jgi:biofilm PGA synthesis N-glycosyltransferase PgaC